MNNYDYPIGADVSWAPWNEADTVEYCPRCNSQNIFDAATKTFDHLKKRWKTENRTVCRNCWNKY